MTTTPLDSGLRAVAAPRTLDIWADGSKVASRPLLIRANWAR